MKSSRRLMVFAIIALSAIAGGGSYLTRGPSAEELLGVPLPASARVLHLADRAGLFGGDYFVVIEMPEADFQQLVVKLALVHRPDLLQYWPNALGAPKEIEWWNLNQVNDENTFFGDQRHSTYLVARYEGGKMYYKVHVY
jgi:hypothetical protein